MRWELWNMSRLKFIPGTSQQFQLVFLFHRESSSYLVLQSQSFHSRLLIVLSVFSVFFSFCTSERCSWLQTPQARFSSEFWRRKVEEGKKQMRSLWSLILKSQLLCVLFCWKYLRVASFWYTALISADCECNFWLRAAAGERCCDSSYKHTNNFPLSWWWKSVLVAVCLCGRQQEIGGG